MAEPATILRMPQSRPPARSFRDLQVWRKAHQFVLGVYPFQVQRDSLLQAAEICLIHLIHLDSPSQPVAVWAHHGTSQLMQPRPGRFVTPQLQHPLEAQGARTVLLARDPSCRPEPKGKGFAGILKDRPGRHRTLVAATRTLQQNDRYRPGPPPATARTTKSHQASGVENRYSRQAASVEKRASNSRRSSGKSSIGRHTTGCGYLAGLDDTQP